MIDGKKLFGALQEFRRTEQVVLDDLSDALRILLILGDRAALSSREEGWVVRVRQDEGIPADGAGTG